MGKSFTIQNSEPQQDMSCECTGGTYDNCGGSCNDETIRRETECKTTNTGDIIPLPQNSIVDDQNNLLHTENNQSRGEKRKRTTEQDPLFNDILKDDKKVNNTIQNAYSNQLSGNITLKK